MKAPAIVWREYLPPFGPSSYRAFAGRAQVGYVQTSRSSKGYLAQLCLPVMGATGQCENVEAAKRFVTDAWNRWYSSIHYRKDTV